MSNLVETLAAELERPRELSARVLNYIEDNYNVEHDAVGIFLTEELPKLEDYEIDLILSPVFTPKLADQAVFAELLGRGSVPREQWPVIVEQLAERPSAGAAAYELAEHVRFSVGLCAPRRGEEGGDHCGDQQAELDHDDALPFLLWPRKRDRFPRPEKILIGQRTVTVCCKQLQQSTEFLGHLPADPEEGKKTTS